MGVNFLNLLTGANVKTAQLAQGSAVTSARAVNPYSKAISFAAVPSEKAPRVIDSVPTKYADGTPFWADYVTPNKSWVC